MRLNSRHGVSALSSLIASLIFLGMGVLGGWMAPPVSSAQPKPPVHAMTWGIKAYQQGHDELALRYFKQVWAPQAQLVGLKPVDATALVWQAKCYHRLGNTTASAQAINKALALATPGTAVYATATQTLHELFPPLGAAETETVPLQFKQRMGLGVSSLDDQGLKTPLPKGPLPKGSLRVQLWQQPIWVYMQPQFPPSLSGKQAQRLAMSTSELESLVRQWQPALPSTVPIHVTTQAGLANVTLEWVDEVEALSNPEATNNPFANSPFTSGVTQWQVSNAQLVGATIRVAVKTPQGRVRTKVALLQTVLHELGHALGMAEHSGQVGDIMAAHGVGSFQVSPNDVMRLKALYVAEAVSPSVATTVSVHP